MKVKIMSLERTIFEGKAQSVVVPSRAGEITILEDHAPLLTLLAKGEILIDNKRKIEVSEGILYCVDNNLIILVK